MKTKRNKNVMVVLACALALGTGASTAQAQSGGTGAPGSVGPAQATPASGPSWTVYKKATWYGPGFWGNQTACGLVLQPTVIGVAHKKLPCGTQVSFSHAGRTVAATVIDRGPFHKGYAWDLTKKTAKRLGFLTVGSGPIAATVTPVTPVG
ncbi:MAG: septal ring lytic transglycosylase RlpA family protein [Solirubrobacterales bacterium]